jgi:hypothetical protein
MGRKTRASRKEDMNNDGYQAGRDGHQRGQRWEGRRDLAARKICTTTDIRREETVIRADRDGKEDGDGQSIEQRRRSLPTEGGWSVSET